MKKKAGVRVLYLAGYNSCYDRARFSELNEEQLARPTNYILMPYME